jgi:hypothetical protein
MKPSGIEPATFRFVAQHLSYCAPPPRVICASLITKWKWTTLAIELQTEKDQHTELWTAKRITRCCHLLWSGFDKNQNFVHWILGRLIMKCLYMCFTFRTTGRPSFPQLTVVGLSPASVRLAAANTRTTKPVCQKVTR